MSIKAMKAILDKRLPRRTSKLVRIGFGKGESRK
jgi:hypothetical protein